MHRGIDIDGVDNSADMLALQSQALELVHDAGFTQIELLRDFTFQPAIPRNRTFTLLAQRP
jgi:hypothetical protein